MSYPTPHTIEHRRYVEGARNSRGNPTETWADPVSVDVYGWAQPTSSEPKIAGRDQVIVDLEVYAPASFRPGPYDLLAVDGAGYTVEGEPEDYNHGPFGFTPGVVINAKRAEG